MKSRIRKIATFMDETLLEQGQPVTPPVRRAAAVAVIENPYAGVYQRDLSLLMDIGEELGGLLAERAVAALGIPGDRVESYGKAAAVGENGEIEHAAAILHPWPPLSPASGLRPGMDSSCVVPWSGDGCPWAEYHGHSWPHP